MSNRVATPTALYQGVFSTSGELANGTIVHGGKRKNGGKVESYRCVCMNSTELSENVSTKLSLDLGIGPFSIGGSVSSSTEFVRSSFTAYVVLFTHCRVGEVSQENATIDDEKLPKNDKAVRYFARRNGDSYISELVEGASYYAIYSFTFDSLAEKEKFGAKTRASGIIKIVTFDAEAQMEMEKFKQKTNASCTLYQVIHGPTGVAFPTEDKMGEFALKFPEIAEKKKTIRNDELAIHRVRNRERKPRRGGLSKSH